MASNPQAVIDILGFFTKNLAQKDPVPTASTDMLLKNTVTPVEEVEPKKKEVPAPNGVIVFLVNYRKSFHRHRHLLAARKRLLLFQQLHLSRLLEIL